MIKKSSIAPMLLILAVLCAAASVSAQVRPRLNRILKEQRMENADADAGQIGRPRIPRGGANRGPLGGQDNPLPGAKQNRRQQLQRLVMQRLGLTPDQRMRMQAIRRSHDDDVIASGRRLRQARAALDGAIMNDNFSEEAVRRATDELVAAQGERIRLQARIRSQVRGVLTPEQVQEFHRLERELRRERQQQKREMQERQMGAAEPLGPPSRLPLDEDGLDLVSLLLFEN